MRIITGEYRGRRLETPYGNDVRPTGDKVRESVFNLLMYDIDGAVFCDLFAGTGAIGLEALSRGAEKAYFCDASRDSIRIIKTNIEKCRASARSRVFACDYLSALRRIKEKVDIFYIDPPYNSGFYVPALEEIDSLDLLSEKGIIVAEHRADESLPDLSGRLKAFKEKKYGHTKLTLYSCARDDQKDNM